jgi:hypothetical protein
MVEAVGSTSSESTHLRPTRVGVMGTGFGLHVRELADWIELNLGRFGNDSENKKRKD